jgi:uncharacterized protein YbjT (DUF2867 family)
VVEGHDVSGMTRSPAKVDILRELGADPVVCDVYEADALRDAVVDTRAQAIVHLLTDLPDDEAEIPRFTAANARIRREGTRNLLMAAEAAGTTTFLAESLAWRPEGDAGTAIDDLERAVLDAGGVVLRYGQLYGPGTYFEHEPPSHPRIEIGEAARRTALALDQPSGIVEIVERP